MIKQFSYTIYQCPPTVKYCFRDYDSNTFEIYDYVAVWRDDDSFEFRLEPADYSELLEDLFAKFNSDRLTNYAGRSMATSDVICLEIDGEILWFYCNNFGFVQLPEEKTRD